jgi:Zn-finger nucleic acid-binding protein
MLIKVRCPYCGYRESIVLNSKSSVEFPSCPDCDGPGQLRLENTVEETRQVAQIMVKDPDTGHDVTLTIVKCQESGAMVGIDASYVDQEVGPVGDPYNEGHTLLLE